MLSRLTAQGRGVPNLVVAQRVVDKMIHAARLYAEDETGEAMVGLLAPGTHTNGVPTLYVLDTISPDATALRMMHTFQQGDERQDELIWWLQENWRFERERGGGKPAKWDVPLRYLGDWHKQPGYMIQPSGGDLMTALDWIEDPENHMDFLLAPIVTLDHHPTTSVGEARVNFLTVPQGDGMSARVDFWYIDREHRIFMPIFPAVYPDDQLPALPAYPWHLVDEGRFTAESNRLAADGLFTTLVLWEADDTPPLEVCFLALRAGATKALLLVTPWNYPKAPPSARVATYAGIRPDDDPYTVFAHLWGQSEPAPAPPGWTWAEERTLAEYVAALETALGARPAPATPAPSAAPDAKTEPHDKAAGEEPPDGMGPR